MQWQQLIIYTDGEQAQQISDLLLLFSASAVTLKDHKDEPQFEEHYGEILTWRETEVIALYPAEEDIRAIPKQLAAALQSDSLIHKIEILEDENWTESWKKGFEPICFGDALWIVPSWHEVPDANATNIILDPGMAFGTGSHPTTHLILAWLATQPLAGRTVIDYGCGSGILGLAAAKLGAQTVDMVDNDPLALKTSALNCQQNAVEANYYLPEAYINTKPANIVLANILANPLIGLAEHLAALTAEHGYCVLSGILENQVDELLSVYQQWFKNPQVTSKEDWVRIVLEK